MRLAYVTETYPPEVNGVAATAARTVDWLRSRGHHVLLVRPRQPHEDARDAADEWRTSGAALPMYRDVRAGWAPVGALVRRLRAARIELVHVATEGPLGWAACRAARRLHLPLTSDLRTRFELYGAHYGLGWLTPLIAGYLKHFHDATDRTFVPTRPLAAELEARGWRSPVTVARGVDTARFSPTARSAALRAQWGAGPDDPVVLHVGRLAAEKNVALLARALQAARAAHPRARCVVVGDGPARAVLRSAAPAETHYTGVLRGDELAAHYASADVFVFPSETETFGNVVLEALASGLVLVAYAQAAAAEHVAHGVNGWTAHPGDAAAFVALVQRATLRATAAHAMRLLARRSALAASWESVLGGFEAELAAVRAAAPLTQPAYAA